MDGLHKPANRIACGPGTGWSGPVVWGEKVFLTTVVSDRTYEKPRKGLYLGGGRPAPPGGVHHWLTYCLDTQSGEVLWKREAHTGEPKSPRHPKSTYASETPATDGERLYVLFGDVGLYCYDLSGKPIWSQDIEPMAAETKMSAAPPGERHGRPSTRHERHTLRRQARRTPVRPPVSRDRARFQ